ncbi:hypothetical protein CAOG_06797 [Capsaspora owczarzaki ATCC 30864]|uniref:Beta-catenin-like protein 1 N-terminal domain-containing protein n=1 Tax=Capsaspora owczarzaki (strain ATCC 30864) TaxID=595528 RepID=A0A0D2X4Q6_CAPO3|nr:hypothetical protein CAOG_06797 [Capsaspora owczarzaki ATCC 30864]KJE96474.1 hypothetical protein CAOG_006797 [Capsaspora owczarzaki ATCC 30864]|eukprot:XP_004344418.1 hypothetical protein CAOG_06797 [Capsaspora owczarzaki ATCC 30864]
MFKIPLPPPKHAGSSSSSSSSSSSAPAPEPAAKRTRAETDSSDALIDDDDRNAFAAPAPVGLPAGFFDSGAASSSSSSSSSSRAVHRAADEDDDEDEDDRFKRARVAVASQQQRHVALPTDTDDENSISSTAVKRLALALEKRIAKNEEMRIKFPKQPAKFVDSEVELNEELQKLHVLSTAPEFYGELIRLNTPNSLITLLSHDNVDIAIATIELLNELTDMEEGDSDQQQSFLLLVRALVEGSLWSGLHFNLQRLDESRNEESEAVHKILGILENAIECETSMARSLYEQAPALVAWVIDRAQRFTDKHDTADDNRLYASELLAILLQTSQENKIDFVREGGMDSLLRAVAPYKKRDPRSVEEAEMLANLFDCLCALLIVPEHKTVFLDVEGVELMLLLIKSNLQAGKAAVKVLNFAMAFPNGDATCSRFVDKLGLSAVFPWFMTAPDLKKIGTPERQFEEHICTIVAGLFRSLPAGVARNRLLNKFMEADFAKCERLVELHSKYTRLLSRVDQQIARERDEYEEVDDALENEFFMRRLDVGLATLQLVDTIILELLVSGIDEIRSHLLVLLAQQRLPVSSIDTIVLEFIDNLAPEEAQRVAALHTEFHRQQAARA